MFLLEAVETHRHRAQAGIHQAAQPRVVEGHAVGHHTPRIAPAGHFGPRDLQIGPHEHLASRKDKQHAAGIDMGRDLLVQHPQEILQRHILHPRIDTAVAAAMTAGQITAKRTLPEECTQPVLPHLVGIQIGKQTQSDPFAQTGTAAAILTLLRLLFGKRRVGAGSDLAERIQTTASSSETGGRTPYISRIWGTFSTVSGSSGAGFSLRAVLRTVEQAVANPSMASSAHLIFLLIAVNQYFIPGATKRAQDKDKKIFPKTQPGAK